MIAALQRLLSGRPAPAPSIGGWWLDTPIRLRAKKAPERTASVSSLTARVDVAFCVEGGRVVLRSVALSKDGEPNLVAVGRGKAWRAGGGAVPAPLPLRAAERDLAGADSRLRRALLAKWNESDPAAAAGLLAAALNGRARADRVGELIGGCGVDLSFTYTNGEGEATARRVTVQALSGDAIRCLDLSDDKVKSFRLDRISDAEPG